MNLITRASLKDWPCSAVHNRNSHIQKTSLHGMGCGILYRLLRANQLYLHCVINGDTTALHKLINIRITDGIGYVDGLAKD